MARLDKVRDRSAHVGERVSASAKHGREVAATKGSEAWEWASPRVEHARERAAEWGESAREAGETAYEKAREDLVPKVTAAITAATAAAEPLLEEARTRGGGAIAALRGEPVVVKKRRRWPKVLLFVAALVGGAAAGWRAWQSQQGRGGQTLTTVDEEIARNPSGGAGPVGVGAAVSEEPAGSAVVGGTDSAGASPDEALADATMETNTPGETAALTDEPLPAEEPPTTSSTAPGSLADDDATGAGGPTR